MNQTDRKPQKPKLLKPGDGIGIITPASPMPVEKLHKGVDYLKSLGYRTFLGEHVYDSYGYLAGRDRDRVNDLHFMFENPEIKAIISSRGGYGTPRLLDRINYDLIAANPKIFVGYSDLTALQLAIWRHTGLITFSGPMVAVEMGKGIDPFTEQNFWPLLTQTEVNGFFTRKTEKPVRVMKQGKATGTLLGGCLSLINSVIGTGHQPAFDEAILILEDVGEEPYRIDRYLAQLQSAGIFNRIKGLILGQFVDCEEKEKDPTLTLDEIFSEYFGSLSIPIVKSFLYGHIPKKFTVPIGVRVEIDTSVPVVKLLESPVESEVS